MEINISLTPNERKFIKELRNYRNQKFNDEYEWKFEF